MTEREWIQPASWRQAWRSLVKRPAYFASAVATLAFGAAITTAGFSLVDTVLVKPLPYPDADQLVTVFESSPSAREKTSLVAPGRLEDWNRLNTTFTALSGSYGENVTDTSGAEPERLQGRRVSPRFFNVFAAPPILGRFFTEDEERWNGPGAAVISDAFWQRRFQRSRTAIGHALIIGGRSYQIVGVVPPLFTSAAIDVWLPAQQPPGLLRARDARFVNGIGRLKPGVSQRAGSHELVTIQESLAKEFPKTDSGWSVEIRSLKEAQIGDSRRNLLLVFGAVMSLWVIAIANIAGLTLVQVQRRTRELAIRAALGASRGRVIGSVMREGGLIAIVGGVLGVLAAGWVVSLMPLALTRTPRINELALDWRALGFVIVTSLAACCAFSLLPAWTATRGELHRAIASDGRSVAGGRHRLQRLLVVGQVGVSLALVASATLLLRSYYNLTHVEIGFDASEAMTFRVAARWDEDRTLIGQFQERFLARLDELPHVEAAGVTNFLPVLAATLRYQYAIDGVTGPNADGSVTAGSRMIGGEYLSAINARLIAGEGCPPLRNHGAPPFPALLNQRFVEVFAPDRNLLGHTFRVLQGFSTTYTITGIVGNIAEDGPAMSVVPYVYTCTRGGWWPDPEYVVRTTNAATLTADVRRIVRELDPTRAVFGMRRVQDVVDAGFDQPRLDAAVLSVFAAAALTLAAIGLYSLFMLVLAERAREMALRLAVGAEPRQLMRLLAAAAARLLLGGMVLGLVLTAAADRLLRGVLFGVTTIDARALSTAALTLAIVCAIAVAGPALRAARIAPIDALRGD